MNKKTKIILIIVLIVAFIALIILLLLLGRVTNQMVRSIICQKNITIGLRWIMVKQL